LRREQPERLLMHGLAYVFVLVAIPTAALAKLASP